MILSICPTFNRPDECFRMVKSFKGLSTEYNKLILLFSNNEPRLDQYKDSLELVDGYHILPSTHTITELINSCLKIYSNIKYYHITNDDVIYKTLGWDNKLVRVLEDYGSGISYGDDLLQGKNLCTFPMITADLPEKLGWLQMPKLNRYCGDVVWKFIGENCDCLYYVPGVIIQHKWQGADATINKEDMAKFAEWLQRSHIECDEVREVVNGT